MKRKTNFLNYIFASIAIFTISGNIFGQQEIKVDFQMQYNGIVESVDSVFVANLTNGGFTKLYYPDTSLVLVEGASGIHETNINSSNQPVLSPNYPNPFTEQTAFDIFLPKSTCVTIIVSDITGRKLAQYENKLDEGNHQFTFYPGSENIYILSLLTNNNISTIRMIHSGSTTNNNTKIVYEGNDPTKTLPTTETKYLKSTAADFTFSPGDELQYVGYTTQGLIYNNIIVDKPTESKTYTFETDWGYLDNPLAGLELVYNTFYYEGSYLRSYPWYLDVRADDMQSASPWAPLDSIDKFSVDQYEQLITCTWINYFNGITRANQVIEYVPGIEMDSALKSRIVGEAIFLRGLFNYQLLQIFNTIPLSVSVAREFNEYYPPQSSREVVWGQIITDFSAATELLPAKYITPEDIGRATKGAAQGFLGKSYMITKQYSNAANILKNIIDNGQYALMADYRDNFTLDKENNSESLFEIQFDKDLGGTTRGWYINEVDDLDKTGARIKAYAASPYGWGDAAPTDWIYEEFLLEQTTDGKDDLRLGTSLWHPGNDSTIYGDPSKTVDDLHYGRSITMENKIFIRKYLNDTPEPENEWRSEINERILRFADILLLYAEAQNELNNTMEAYQYINMVRSRAGLPGLTPGMTIEQMRVQIAHERALEFCFEGIRYTDLLRWGWFENSTTLNTLKSRDNSYNFYSAGREYLPVPKEALTKNPFLSQSPGW